MTILLYSKFKLIEALEDARSNAPTAVKVFASFLRVFERQFGVMEGRTDISVSIEHMLYFLSVRKLHAEIMLLCYGFELIEALEDAGSNVRRV